MGKRKEGGDGSGQERSELLLSGVEMRECRIIHTVKMISEE